MENIREYLKKKILVADGATGTYVSSLMGRNLHCCEMLNRSDPDLVLNIHRQYLSAGSKMIAANTFSANTLALGQNFTAVADILKAGVELARKAANNQAYVAADIGPISEEKWDFSQIEAEYRKIADIFLSQGIDLFLFETFASADFPVRIARYIKSRCKNAFIITDFAVQPDGYSHRNISGEKLIGDVIACGAVDAAGFNCSSGPAHLLQYASGIDFQHLIPALMPNAGYPQMEKDYFKYASSPEYFADKIGEAVQAGFRIVGGCCGTTPEHIRHISAVLAHTAPPELVQKPSAGPAVVVSKTDSAFYGRRHYKKLAVTELDPPFSSDISGLETAAALLRSCGVDAVTIPDSPMARPRVDSISVAAHIKRTVGIEAIPHVTCRDKNLNALKSSILAAHMEHIRNLLVVTGDPVSETDRGNVKSVYNLNSAGLCSFIQDLNGNVFSGDPMHYGCAYNVNAPNIRAENERLAKKISGGATFLLTQPVFGPQAALALKEAKKSGIVIIAGILTPVSYKNARFLTNEIPGICLPPGVLAKFSPEMTREEGESAGIAISVATAEKIAEAVDGYYFIPPFNRVHVVVKIIEELCGLGIL